MINRRALQVDYQYVQRMEQNKLKETRTRSKEQIERKIRRKTEKTDKKLIQIVNENGCTICNEILPCTGYCCDLEFENCWRALHGDENCKAKIRDLRVTVCASNIQYFTPKH